MITLASANANPGRYLQELTRDSYHQEREQAALIAGGALAKEIGLTGEITEEMVRNVLDGYTADRSRKLVRGGRKKRHRGLDLVAAVPKWFSLLYAIGDASLRERLTRWLLEAVQAMLTVAERELALTRRGAGGVKLEHAEAITFVLAIHPASRAGAPHLHVHAVIPSLCRRADRTTGTLVLEEFFHNRRLLTSVFHEELAQSLQHGLGLTLERAKLGYELVVPEAVALQFQELRRRWSPGRAAIQEHLTSKGFSGGKAAEIAQKKLRPKKSVEDYSALIARWQAEAASVGLSLEALVPQLRPEVPLSITPTIDKTRQRHSQGIASESSAGVSHLDFVEHAVEAMSSQKTEQHRVASHHERDANSPGRLQEAIGHKTPHQDITAVDRGQERRADASFVDAPQLEKEFVVSDPEEIQRLLNEVAADLTRTRNHFSERTAVARMIQIARALETPSHQLVSELLRFLRESDQIVRLGHARSGHPFFTTRQRWDQEQRLLDHVRAAKEETAKPFSTARLSEAIREAERAGASPFDQSQREALYRLAMGECPISVVHAQRGPATDAVLRAFKRTAEAEGWHVVGAAATAQDALELERRSGVPSQSLHKWLLDYERRRFTPARDLLRELLETLLAKRPRFDHVLGRFLERGVETVTSWALDTRAPFRLSGQTLLVLEGAQKLPVDELADMLELSRLSGGRALLVGHARGLPALMHPGAFQAIEALLRPASLGLVGEATTPWLRRAQDAFLAGNAPAAFHEFCTQQRLTITDTREQALGRLIEDWKRLGVKRPRQNPILTSSKQARFQANVLAQQARRRALRIAPFHFLRVGEYKIRQEDRVVFTHGLRLPGGLFPRRVRSGERGRVVRVDILKRRIQVRTDSGVLVMFDPKRLQPIQLDYARTIYRSETQLAPRAFVLLEGESRQSLSAKLTSASQDIHLYGTAREYGNPLKHLIDSANRVEGQVLASSWRRELQRQQAQQQEIQHPHRHGR